MEFKHWHSQSTPQTFDALAKGGKHRMRSTEDPVFDAQPHHNRKLGVSREVYADLMKLCDTNVIPPQHQKFYRELPEPAGWDCADQSDSD